MAKPKLKVRHVAFTPREMAEEGPTAEERLKWKPVGRGKEALFRKRPPEPVIRLDEDVAQVFSDSKSVNAALRGLIDLARQTTGASPTGDKA